MLGNITGTYIVLQFKVSFKLQLLIGVFMTCGIYITLKPSNIPYIVKVWENVHMHAGGKTLYCCT